MLQLHLGQLGENADHRRDAVFLVVFLEDFDHQVMLLGQLVDTFLLFDVLDPLLAPMLVISDETVLINVEFFALESDCCHLKKPPLHSV